MTHNHSTQQSQRPFRQAFREARALVILSFAVAITYNLFAATSIPWIREPLKANQGSLGLPGDTTTSAPIAELDTTTNPAPIDTVTGTPVDTAVADGLSQKQIDSLAKVSKDSLKLAKKMETARIDSIRKAEDAALFEKLATATEIQTDVAKRLFDSKKVLFIDARPEDHFLQGHIPGSRNVYAEQWQSQIPELVQIPREQIIVTYCGGGDECELSHDLAKNLKALGFQTVVVYMGGIKDWTAKKYPITTSQ